MKLLVVVLALATLALAEPEADPAYLYRGFYGHPHLGRYWGFGYGYLGYRGYYGRSAYGYGLPGHSYTHVDRLHKREADAQVALPAGLVYNGAIAPAAFAPLAPYAYHPAAVPTALTAAVTDVTYTAPEVTVAAAPVAPYFAPYVAPYAAPVVPAAVPAFSPHDCVTATGCQVKALKLAGLAKREATAEAEAEAEAQADASAHYYGYYGYRPYGYYGYYNGFYNYPYRYGYYGGYPYAPYTYPVAAAPAPAPAVVKSAPVAPVKPGRPVTYTHLGSTPIQPTTVWEEY